MVDNSAEDSSNSWESSHKKLIKQYQNYYALEKNTNISLPKVQDVTIQNIKYKKIGPFNIKFGTAKISNYTLNDISMLPSKNDADASKIMYEDGTVHDNINEATEYGTNFDISGKNFYLLIGEKLYTNTVQNDEVIVEFTQAKFTYKKGRAFICNNYTNIQGNIWYNFQTSSVAKQTVSYKVGSGNITVQKKDSNSGAAVEGVQIRLYGKVGTTTGWVDSLGYLKSYSAVSATSTNSSGKVVYGGLEKGTYYAYEFGVPAGYDLADQRKIYPDSNDPNKFAGTAKYGNCVYLGTIESTSDAKTLERFQYPLGQITVQKTVNNTGVKGIGLKIYGDTSIGKGWIKSDGKIDSNYNNGYKFTTATDGKVTVKNLRMGTYYIYEVSVEAGYTLESQRAKYPNANDPNWFAWNSSYGNPVYLGMVSVSSNTQIASYLQYPQGSLTIEKCADGKGLSGVSLKIYSKTSLASGWLKSNGKLESSYSSGDTFTTDANGKVTVGNLISGTYYIYEIGVPSGYYLADQREKYPDARDDKNKFAGNKDYGNGVYLGSVTVTQGTATASYEQYQQKGSITIEKKSGGKGLAGVSAKIYGETTSGNGWVKSDGTLGSSYSDGKTFTTGTDGKVTATKLRKGTYYIYEIGVPSGYDLEDQRKIYPNSNDPKGYAGSSSYGKAVYLGKLDSNADSKTITKDQVSLGSITIKKIDSNTKGGLSGVLLKVYGVTSIGTGWVTSTGSITSSYNYGETFKTDSNGNVTVNNLRRGTYYIYEIGVPSEYDLEDQRAVYPNEKDPQGLAGTANSGKGVYLGSTTCNSQAVPISFEQYGVGSITVQKLNGNSNVSGVSLKIYGKTSIGNGWVKADGSISSTYSGGQIFKTGTDGKITASKLRRGTYYIYEVGVTTGYDLSDQRQMYPDSRDPNKLAGTSNSGNGVFLGNIDCKSIVASVKYSQYPLNSLTIRKVIGDTENGAQGIGLKLYGQTSIGNGWVKSDKTISSNYSDGAVFTTGASGTVTIGDLRKGTYYVYEVSVPREYELEEQRIIYPNTKDPNKLAGTAKSGNGVYLGQTTFDENIRTLTYKQRPLGSITVQKLIGTTGVSGVSVRVYGDTSVGKGWVTSTGAISSSYSSSAAFKTGTNGKVTINNLRKGTYYIYETEVPTGYDLEDQRQRYPDANDPNKLAGNTNYGKGVYLGTAKCSEDTQIVQYKQDPLGTLNIQKVVGNTGIRGISLKVYGKTSIGNGWVTSTGTIASSYSNGNTFITGKDGKVTVNNLRKGTYYIYEIGVPAGYDLEDQRQMYPNKNDTVIKIAGTAKSGNGVYLGSATCNANTQSIKFNQYPLGKFTIQKVVGNVGVKDVKLKVYGKTTIGNGWVTATGKITSSYTGGQTFITGTDGMVSVNNLRRGTYYIYEIGVPTGYDLEDQRQMYPDKNDTDNKIAGNTSYGKAVYLGSTTCNTETKSVKYNQYPLGALTVQKVVGNKGIGGIGVRLYGKTSMGTGWVTADGTIKSSYAEAKVFTTGSDGKVTAYNLRRGTYYIYEYSVPEPYHIEEQRVLYPNSSDPNKLAGTTNSGNGVYIGTKDCLSESVSIKLTQRETPRRTIQITKQDKNTGNKISNVGFKVMQKLSRYIVQGGVRYEVGSYVWLKSDGTITTDVSKASTITTDKNGQASISGIMSLGACYIYEVTPANGYEIEDQIGYLQGKPNDYTGTFLSGNYVYNGTFRINQNTNSSKAITFTAYNEKTRGTLGLIKSDGTYESDLNITGKIYLAGAKIKIYGESSRDGSKGWLKKGTTISGKVKYDYGSYNEATEFTTDSNGKIKATNLLFGTYYIYETQAPTGYNIKTQDGYKAANKGSTEIGATDWAYLGSTSVSYENQNVSYNIVNKKYTSIYGKVWIDVPDTKDNMADNLYISKSKDRLLGNITVNLYDRRTKQIIATTKTLNSGEYKFSNKKDGTKITYWNAAYYYVEFIYDNKNYICATPFKGDSKQIANNSKAQEEQITNNELNDSNLTGTSGNLPGKAITYKGTETKIDKAYIEKNSKNALNSRLLTGYLNESTYNIENVNLGIVEKVKPEHVIGQSIEYVKIQKGEYTFKYKYGETAVTEQGALISTVKYQNSKKSFTQKLYPSDILYNAANGKNGSEGDAYKVYVVYKIDVKNITTIDLDDLYKENKFYLTSLINTYDATRYELSTAKSGDDSNISKDFSEWTVSSEGKAQYRINSNTKFTNGLGKNEVGTAYIQFKVKNEALTTLVQNGNLSESATKAETTGYHTYQRKDKNWANNNLYTHKSVQEKNEHSSLSLKWNLFTTRTISGTIFEDTKDNARTNERVGNGIYDSTEKKVSGVVVSLIDENGQTAYLYEDELKQNMATGKWHNCKKKAIVQVNGNNGTYSLKGVVPGKYYLKFTYGDGKSKVTDLNGNVINVETKIQGQKINSNYYKSTILTGPAKNSSTNQYWYLNNIGTNYSIATDSKGTYFDDNGNALEISNSDYYDIINARTTSTREINNTSSKYKVVIDAMSPLMDIKFEYSNSNEMFVEKDKLNTLKTDCTGMSFGIIERPHVNIVLEKKISNVKLTLTDGSTLINRKIDSQDVQPNVSVINQSNVKIETEYANLYGSTLTVEYEMVVTNESELDYATKDYYTKGTKSGMPVATTVTKIIDYLSYAQGKYSELSSNISETDNYKDEGYVQRDYFVDGVIYSNRDYKNQLLITTQEKLLPKYYNSGTSEAKFKLTTSRLIPSAVTEEELGMESYAEIIGIKNVTFTTQYSITMGNYKVGDYKTVAQGGTSEPDNGASAITITPPTGRDRSYTIYIISAAGLIIIASGIIIIKKFVL